MIVFVHTGCIFAYLSHVKFALKLACIRQSQSNLEEIINEHKFRILQDLLPCCQSIQHIRCCQGAVYIPASRKSGDQSSGAGDRHRTVHPNQERRLIYSHVAAGYESISLGEQQLSQLLHMETGEISIGASDMTLQFYLLPYLEHFHQLYPGIKVHVTNAPTPSTINHLLSGNIDFGIVTSPLPADPHMEIRQAREIEDIFIAGPRFSYLQGKTLDYHELDELPIICLEHDTSTRAYVDTFLSHEGVTLQPEFELSTSDMIAQFVMRNLGVGSIMADFAQSSIDRGDLFRLQFKKPIPKRHMCIISDRRRGMSVAANKLMELL